jgi:hypothetical protein
MTDKSKEDVLQLLDSLDQENVAIKSDKAKVTKVNNAGDDDIMGFLDSLTKSGANSGKSTPRLERNKPNSSEDGNTVSARSSAENEKVATKAESSSPVAPTSPIPEQLADPLSSISNWWSRNKGDIWSTATSAVKQAEAKVRELQPEVQSSQQRAFESLGDRFSKMGLSKDLIQSTLSSVLETIAPPISRHEQLRIHVFHDMVGYPAVDNIVYGVFDRVMQQVEGGGKLTMVVQKGKERHRRGSNASHVRDFNMFRGDLEQGTKLAAANIEDFMRPKDTNKEGQRKDTDSEANETEKSVKDSEFPNQNIRISDIYLSIQPASAYPETPKVGTTANSSSSASTAVVPNQSGQTFYYVIYLKDPVNDISFSTVSQAFPLQWAEWLDSPDSVFESFEADPREWVIDWVEEGLGLAVGVVAQSYVAKRMGVDVIAEAEQIAKENASK